MTPGCIAITGLGTFLGQRLAERLLESHDSLRLLGVGPRRPLRLQGRVEFVSLDLTEPTSDARLADILAEKGVDVLVHTAFRHSPTPEVEYDHDLETVGTLHVMNACSAAKVGRLIVASSTMLYGPRADNPNFLTEEHPLRGHRGAHLVSNRVEMEGLLASWHRRHPDVDLTVLRHCWIMGPSYDDHVVRFFERPVVPMLLGYDPLLQFIHEDDLVDVFERAALESHPGVFNVVGPGVLPLSTLWRWPARSESVQLPSPLLYRLAYYPSQGQTGDSPAGFYDYLRYLWVADGERGWAEFGEPSYSTKEAWISFVSSRRMRRYR